MKPTIYYRFDLPSGVMIDGRAFLADVETLRAMAEAIRRACDPALTAGDALLDRVAGHWQVGAAEMRGKRRLQSLVFARWHFAHLAVENLGWSQRDVDRFFDHGKGTASYGRRMFKDLLSVDKQLRERVEAFKL